MATSAGLGSITLGEDFVLAGNHLFESKVQFRHSGPIEYLFAHGLELLLKGVLMLAGESQQNVEAFSHKILELYDAAGQHEQIMASIDAAERRVKNSWRIRLRDAGNEYAKNFDIFSDMDPDHLKEFGVHDNATIGDELPEFRNQVIWLDKRHRSEGGQLRYPKKGVDQRETIKKFGLNDDIVLQSMSWGCQFLASDFIKMSKSSSKL